MRRCFSSLGCPELSLADALALAARHRIPAVEVRALGGRVDLPGYFTEQFGSPANLARQWHARVPSVRIVALDASLRLVGATARAREELAELAPWADAVEAPWLRVFDGGQLADTAEIQEAAATLAWWEGLRRTHRWRVNVMVETHDSLLTAVAIARLLAVVPATAILWDAHHTWRKGGESPLVTWPSIRRRVVHIHVKDSVDRPSARHPFTYVLPGDGEFPGGELRAGLHAEGYAGFLSLEWERMWHPHLPPLAEALRTAEERGWW